jgi:hypothetical protein
MSRWWPSVWSTRCHSDKPLKAALVLLAALHDLGKINAAFRSMLETGEPQRVGRHWEVSEALLRLHDATVLAPVLGARESRRHMRSMPRRPGITVGRLTGN